MKTAKEILGYARSPLLWGIGISIFCLILIANWLGGGWFRDVTWFLAGLVLFLLGILAIALFFTAGSKRLSGWVRQISASTPGERRGERWTVSEVALTVLLIALTTHTIMRVVDFSKNHAATKIFLLAVAGLVIKTIIDKRGKVFKTVAGGIFTGLLLLTLFAILFYNHFKWFEGGKLDLEKLIGPQESSAAPSPSRQTFPFCENPKLDQCDEPRSDFAQCDDPSAVRISLDNECWTVVKLDSSTYANFECRHLENMGIWYWSRSTGRAVFMRPNTYYPYRDRMFYVRGEGKLLCSYLGR